jgi:hypothetical protein
MNNFTATQKQKISDQGAQVKFVAFNPNTTTEPAAPAGYTEYYRETTANLVEIVYCKPAVI